MTDSREEPFRARWPAWTAPVALIVALVASVVGAGVIAGILSSATGSTLGHPRLAVNLLATAFQDVALVATAVIFARAHAAPTRPGQFGLRRVNVRSALGWAVLAYAASFLFNAAWTSAVGVHQHENLHSELGLGGDLPGILGAALVVTVIAPVAEELFFRGYFFAALARWRGPGLAAVLTGIVFGAVHGLGQTPVAFLVPLAFLGFVLCLLYRRTGSVLPGIALHVINNVLAFGLDEHWGWQIPVLLAGSLGAVAVLLGPALVRAPRAGAPAPA